MKTTWREQAYTNFILTLIAVLLAIWVLGPRSRNLDPAQPATAQDFSTRSSSGFSSPGKSAPVDTSNVATVQDLAVAGATAEVAAANREIASAIRDLAKAVQDLGNNINRAMSSHKPAGGAAAPSSDIQVQVGQ